MTALSDALAAAQSRAVAALGKQYVGGQLDGDALRIALDGIGLRDPSDTDEWIAALDVIRETGATLPREKRRRREDGRTGDGRAARVREAALRRERPADPGRTADEGAGARSDRHAESRNLRRRPMGGAVLVHVAVGIVVSLLALVLVTGLWMSRG